jgi:hypothetical protein
MPLHGPVSGSNTKLNDGTSNLIAGSGVTITSGSGKAVTITNSAGSVAGSNTQIQYNSSGDFGAGAELTFDGDTLTATNASNTAIPAIAIDRNYTGTTSVGNTTIDASGLLVDYDVTGIVASGQTAIHDAIAINYNQDAPTHVGNVLATGTDIRMTGGTSGAQSMKGVAITLAGADSNIGIDITVPNDGTHFIARSPDNVLDHFQISVGAAGSTTLSTSDADASLGHLTLDADGKIILNALAGKEVVLNDDSENVDFRVESQNEDEAILLDASDDSLHINKGETDFATYIYSINDVAIGVDEVGVVFNEDGHATNDFRVESDTKTHAVFVDSGNDQVLILSGGAATSTNEATGTDVAFYVSGTLASKNSSTKGAALFGGDVVVSGTLYAGTAVAVDALTITDGEIDLSSGNLTLDVAGDIVLDAAGNNVYFDASGTRVMSIMNISSDVYLQPTVSNKDLILATQGDNTVLTVDSSDSALKINRNLGLTTNTLMNSSAALSATAPFNKIVNSTGSDITGSLPDPTFEGQVQIVLGLQSSSGNCIVTYLNAAGSTTTKTLTNGIAITLISFDATGGGAYRWCPVGDVS